MVRRRARRLRTWLLAAAGLLIAGLAALLLTLPDTAALAKENPERTAFMRRWAKEREAAGERAAIQWKWVPLSRISRELQRAVLIGEDHSFFSHHGVDWREMRVSFRKDLEEKRLARGGSTITMQTAKNLYLSPSKNPLRKIREVLIAWKMEMTLPKERILEIYLNVAEWGEGIYGAEAASRAYFGVSASAIGEEEAALLAASIPNPRRANPAHQTRGLRFRRDLILERMRRFRVEGID